MAQQTDRFIPHDHRCYICGDRAGRNENQQQLTNGIACLIRTCDLPLDVVCNKPECQALAANKVVHAYPGADYNPMTTLPCCGVEMRRTPRADTWSADDKEVTCKGAPVAAAGESAIVQELRRDREELRDQVAKLIELNKSLVENQKPKRQTAKSSGPRGKRLPSERS